MHYGEISPEFYLRELLRLSQPLLSLGIRPKYWKHETLAKIICALIGHHIIDIPEENKKGVFNPYRMWMKYCDRCGKAFIINLPITEKTIKFRRY